MALQLDTTDPVLLRVTFALPVDNPPGAVSVVGSFNDWSPGRHELTSGRDGVRRVTVAVPYEHAVHFRYLADNGLWFDEPDADEVTATGSLLYAVPRPQPTTSTSAPPPVGPTTRTRPPTRRRKGTRDS